MLLKVDGSIVALLLLVLVKLLLSTFVTARLRLTEFLLNSLSQVRMDMLR